MKTIAIILLVIVTLPAQAYDYNTSNYLTISELKSWDGHIDVQFSNGEQHQCSATTNKNRFMSDPSKDYHLSLLLSAFMSGKSVQVAYSCDANGHAWVDGVRVK